MKLKIGSVNALVWSILLIGWGVWTLRLLVTGEVLLFVHPRMTKYISPAAFLFLILGLVQAFQAFRPKSHSGRRFLRWGYAFFLAPLVLTAVAGPQGLKETAADTRILREGSSAWQPLKTPRGISEILASVPADKVLFLDDSIYAAFAEDMLSDPKKYDGRLVSFLGFVHRTPGLEADRVFITRMMITCCVADSEPIGILASWKGVEELKNTEWVQITGKIERVLHKNPYTGKEGPAPLVRAGKVEIGKRPESLYVYPGQF
jgi:putative membrane protein